MFLHEYFDRVQSVLFGLDRFIFYNVLLRDIVNDQSGPLYHLTEGPVVLTELLPNNHSGWLSKVLEPSYDKHLFGSR